MLAPRIDSYPFSLLPSLQCFQFDLPVCTQSWAINGWLHEKEHIQNCGFLVDIEGHPGSKSAIAEGQIRPGTPWPMYPFSISTHPVCSPRPGHPPGKLFKPDNHKCRISMTKTQRSHPWKAIPHHHPIPRQNPPKINKLHSILGAWQGHYDKLRT